jgi:hypothetical protein
MAKQKNKAIWWVLGIGAAVGAYVLYQKRQASAATMPAPAAAPPALPAPATALQPGSAPSMPIDMMLKAAPAPPPSAVAPAPAVVAPSPVTANPVMLSSSIGPIGPGETTDAGVPYDPRMQTLQSWAISTMNPCDLARWNLDQTNFTAAEWNGLYDIYFNDWIGGQGTTTARTQFWDAWRKKYSILTNTPC